MKRRIMCVMTLLGISLGTFAQQTDPVLAGAVATQSAMLQQLFSKRVKTQQKIIAAQFNSSVDTPL